MIGLNLIFFRIYVIFLIRFFFLKVNIIKKNTLFLNYLFISSLTFLFLFLINPFVLGSVTFWYSYGFSIIIWKIFSSKQTIFSHAYNLKYKLKFFFYKYISILIIGIVFSLYFFHFFNYFIFIFTLLGPIFFQCIYLFLFISYLLGIKQINYEINVIFMYMINQIYNISVF